MAAARQVDLGSRNCLGATQLCVRRRRQSCQWPGSAAGRQRCSSDEGGGWAGLLMLDKDAAAHDVPISVAPAMTR